MPTPAAVVAISHVVANAPASDVQPGAGEFVVLQNVGDAEADLTGWALQDAAGQRLELPEGRRLGPGEQLRVHVGPGSDTSSRVYTGRRRAVLSNRGDELVLLDPGGQQVHRFVY